MNKRSVFAAGVVVSLCGTSMGFSLTSFGQADDDLEFGPQVPIGPTSGYIRLAEVLDGTSSNASYVPEFNGGFGLVTGSPAAWATRRADINNSSWFGFDRRGPDGAYSLGIGATNRPAWNAGYATSPLYSGLGAGSPIWTGSGDGDNLVHSIVPSAGGWVFAMGNGTFPPATLGIASDVNSLGGPSVVDGLNYDWAESVFVGRMTLTDPSARLRGTFILLMPDRGPLDGFSTNLDGTTAYNLKLIQVRDGNSINLFVVEIPAPGALGAMGLTGLFAVRRRR